MRSIYKYFVLLAIFSVLISACDGTDNPKTSDVEKTLAALSIQSTVDRAVVLTSEAGGVSGGGGGGSNGSDAGGGGDSGGGDTAPIDTPLPTDIPIPTDTPQPTLTPTSAIPMIVVSIDTNCRVGPGQVYKQVGALLIGETTQIIAWDGFGIYYYVDNPDAAGYCWLWAEYATVSGNTSALPVFTPPPTPTPTFTPTPENRWHGNWNMLIDGTAGSGALTQSGNSISGTLNFGGVSVTVNGTVSADGKTVTGTYASGGTTGAFTWKLKTNVNQFVGNWAGGGASGEWCGYRSGASVPSPCLGP